jgi:hypothetical protein
MLRRPPSLVLCWLPSPVPLSYPRGVADLTRSPDLPILAERRPDQNRGKQTLSDLFGDRLNHLAGADASEVLTADQRAPLSRVEAAIAYQIVYSPHLKPHEVYGIAAGWGDERIVDPANRQKLYSSFSAIMAKPNVIAAVALYRREYAEACDITDGAILRVIGACAITDPIEFVGPDGKLKALADVPALSRLAIRKMRFRDGRLSQVEFYDRLKAAELILSYKGVMPERVGQKTQVSIAWRKGETGADSLAVTVEAES